MAFLKDPVMVTEDKASKGSDVSLMATCADAHTVLKSKTKPPFPDGTERIVFGMGCYWGAERRFWKLPNVYSTQVGYAGGFTKNPTYKQVCTGQTGHTEAVQVVFDPKKIGLQRLLEEFFNEHDPTEKNRQGNDIGTQYRSAVYWTTSDQEKAVKAAAEAFGKQLPKGMTVATELAPLEEFFYAEDYHQQYLQKNKNGYCGLKGSGFQLPVMSDGANKNQDDKKSDL